MAPFFLHNNSAFYCYNILKEDLTMSLAHYITNSKLAEFRNQSPKIVYPTWFTPDNGYHTHEQIESLTTTQMAEIQKCADDTARLARRNEEHNHKLIETIKQELAGMMSVFGVSISKNHNTLYAQYERMIDDIKVHQRLNLTGCYDIKINVKYQDVVYSESSQLIGAVRDTLLFRLRNVMDIRDIQRKLLIRSLTYCISNGISVSHLVSDEEVIKTASEFRRDASIHATFPVGTRIAIRCNGAACFGIHGDEKCNCSRSLLSYQFFSRDTLYENPMFNQLSSWDFFATGVYRHPQVAADICPF